MNTLATSADTPTYTRTRVAFGLGVAVAVLGLVTAVVAAIHVPHGVTDAQLRHSLAYNVMAAGMLAAAFAFAPAYLLADRGLSRFRGAVRADVQARTGLTLQASAVPGDTTERLTWATREGRRVPVLVRFPDASSPLAVRELAAAV